MARSIALWVATAVLAVLYAYAVIVGVGNAIGMVAIGGALDLAVSFAGGCGLALGSPCPPSSP